ncbi:MAG: hypothetical protein RIM72_04835 [Alphaproteobacteria bacterium]
MSLDIAIIAAVTLAGLVLWSRPVHRSTTWKAMATPLASIIGSGFLVLGPILDSAYGKYAPLIMAILCIVAYGYGAAIRYNMKQISGSGRHEAALLNSLETVASWSLGFSYIISVAYYLNLFGAFGVSLTAVDDRAHAQLLTSGVFILILFVGWTRGFKSLERMEYIAVSIELAVIAGLLTGLTAYFYGRAADQALIVNQPTQTGWSAITLAFGLIVTIQGFETSRYLMKNYDVKTCIRSMRWSQFLSSLIYMLYILLLAYVFERGDLKLTETAIVDMMEIVAPILPGMLVAAALAAQFSAAVADTSGAGGLFNELTAERMSPRMAYALLTLVGVTLTWTADVFEIISYASRAFAAYYAIQAAIAGLAAWRNRDTLRCALFGSLALLGVLIAVFGQAVEG